MKIGFLGSGSWGFTLQLLLAEKGYDVVAWTTNPVWYEHLTEKRRHPLFPNIPLPEGLRWTLDIEEATDQKELIAEAVTSSGLRNVFEQLLPFSVECPLVITSKGVEQATLLSLPEVLVDVLGQEAKRFVGIISGPSFAQDVMEKKPTSVVASSYDSDSTKFISQVFNTSTFRVYPNEDIQGVSFGGAMKNIIAVACGIADGMGFGASARAALMTRGLHEMRKIAMSCGAKADTLNGLSGMGDLICTCSSSLSRNYRFGELLAQGKTSQEALDQIGRVVEGTYSVKSLRKLGEKMSIPLPITEAVYLIIYEHLSPLMAVQKLMQREVKDEHL